MPGCSVARPGYFFPSPQERQLACTHSACLRARLSLCVPFETCLPSRVSGFLPTWMHMHRESAPHKCSAFSILLHMQAGPALFFVAALHASHSRAEAVCPEVLGGALASSPHIQESIPRVCYGLPGPHCAVDVVAGWLWALPKSP